MPIRRARVFFLDTDTRSLELFLSVASLLWSVWLGYDKKEAVGQFYAALDHAGGIALWVSCGLAVCVSQAVAVCFFSRKTRLVAAWFAATYWITLAYVTGKMNYGMFYPHFAAFLSGGNLWIVLHKTATGATEKTVPENVATAHENRP